jgi:TatD DNase family protein
MLIDSHCHLDFPDFADDLDGVVGRARAAGVGLMLSICTHLTRAQQVIAIAERFDDVYCTVGIHPHEAGSEPPATVEGLLELARHPKVVAFGETGLDYFYDRSPRDRQQDSFRVHIEAARAAGLPVIIHTRDADADTQAILAEEMGKGAFTGVVHCFSGGPDFARQMLDLGLYLSASGIVTFKAAGELLATLAAAPLDRLLVETDAPFLAPVPMRGKRNEPAFVARTAVRLAEARGIAPEVLAEATTGAFRRLFPKAAR